MTDPYLHLKIGALVEATDGPLSHLHQVILSPTQPPVVGLVVRTGLFPHRDLLVPTELLVDTTDERVVLRVGRDDILRQPAFEPTRYLPPAAEELTSVRSPYSTASRSERSMAAPDTSIDCCSIPTARCATSSFAREFY